MAALVSIAVVVATAALAEWFVDGWLGEARRYWLWLGGIGLLLLGGALAKASGVEALMRYMRTALLGAGIGAVMNRAGLRLGWLRSGLRMFGIETELQAAPASARPGPRLTGWLLWSGWAASLIGLGMVWAGTFGG